MKTYLFPFFFLLVLSSLKGQNFEFFVDKTKFTNLGIDNNQFFVDKVDGYFIFACWHQTSNDIGEPMKFSLQKIDENGVVFDELEFFGENSPLINIHKVGENYLLSYWYYTDTEKYKFHLILINRNFEILESISLPISENSIDPDASFEIPPSRILSYNEENILFAPFPITNELTYLLKLKFDYKGFYKNELVYQEETHMEKRALQIRQPFVINGKIVLYTLNGIIYFDNDLNEVNRISLSQSNIPNYMLSGGAFAAIDSSVYSLGTTVTVNPNKAFPFIAKMGENLLFNSNDTVRLKYINQNSLFKTGQYKYNSMDECFKRQEDGTFTGIMGYSWPGFGTLYMGDGSNSNTLNGRVIITNFDKDLNLLCQNNIYFKDYMISVYRGSYLGNGEYLITGSVDSIEYENDNANREFHPFFGIIKTDCHVPWSEGTLSSIHQPTQDDIKIHVYPNPVHDLIKAEFLDQYNYMSSKIIDVNGREVWRGKSADLREGIKVGAYSNGIYHVLFDGNYVGKFVKL